MRLSHVVTAVQLLAARLVAAAPVEPAETAALNIDPAVDPLDALAQLQAHAYETLQQNETLSKRFWNKGCNLFNTAVRKDW